MDVEPPSFRIVDIEAPGVLQSTFSAQSGCGSARPDPDPPVAPIAQHSGFDFAVPAAPTDNSSKEKTVTGKLIFQSAGHNGAPDPNTSVSANAFKSTVPDPKNTYSETAPNPNLRKVPSGVKKPSEKITLPPKKNGSD
jgi:hypothetical protein